MPVQLFSILIIEDDQVIARSVQKGLGCDGYVVVWRSSAGEGVDYARQHNPHLSVLDVRLPDGSGFDLCRQIRQLGLRQPILDVDRTARRDR